MPRLSKSKAKDTGSNFSSIRSSSSRTNAIPPNAQDAQSPSSPDRLTQGALEVVRQMLLYLDPAAASLLPPSEDSSGKNIDVPHPIPISDWNVLYSSPSGAGQSPSKSSPSRTSIQVLSYPTSDQNLFCVRSVLDCSAKQFWTLMAESGNRHLWDTTTQQGYNHRFFASELPPSHQHHALAKALTARLEYLRFGSIFMVAKPRDMVLLSADVRLPPTSKSPLRLVSCCRSEVDPAKPPVKGYTRYDLGVGGFMVEELESDGIETSLSATRKLCQVTQLSNLGSAASWVPASVVRMVVQTMVPRSVALISKAAAAITVPEPLVKDIGEADIDPQAEIVHGGKERWSKARGLPSQVGVGVLGSSSTPSHGKLSPTYLRSDAPPKQGDIPASNGTMPKSNQPRPPLPPLTMQDLSTPLGEISPPTWRSPTSEPSSASSSQRAVEVKSNGSPVALRDSSNIESSFSLAVPPGDMTVPGSLADFEAPDHYTSAQRFSLIQRSRTQSRLSLESAQSVEQSESVTLATEGSTHDSQGTFTPESGDTSLASRVSKEHLQQIHPDEIGHRLNRISIALQTKINADKIDRTLPIPSMLTGPLITEELEDEETVSNENTDDDDQDDVKELIAEALSISLSSPRLHSHLNPRSPERVTHRQRSPSLIRSPGAKEARREASELSVILLAGSDALVSALAPGAREKATNDRGGESHRIGHLFDDPFAFSSKKEAPNTSQETSTTEEDVLSPPSLPARSKSARPPLTGSASFSQAVTYTSPAYALYFPAIEGFGEIKTDIAMTSWKNALNSTPYALQLGKMAMLWTTEASHARKASHDKTNAASSSFSSDSKGAGRRGSTSPSLRRFRGQGQGHGQGPSPAVRALRSASGNANFSHPKLGRSFSSPANQLVFQPQSPNPSSPNGNGQYRRRPIPTASGGGGGGAGGGGVRIPPEESELRRLSRENYKGNSKLMTSPTIG